MVVECVLIVMVLMRSSTRWTVKKGGPKGKSQVKGKESLVSKSMCVYDAKHLMDAPIKKCLFPHRLTRSSKIRGRGIGRRRERKRVVKSEERSRLTQAYR